MKQVCLGSYISNADENWEGQSEFLGGSRVSSLRLPVSGI